MAQSEPSISAQGSSSAAIATALTNVPASMRALISSTTSSSSQVLADLAPHLMQQRMLLANAAHPSAQQIASTSRSLTKTVGSFARRLPTATYDPQATTSVSLAIKERTEALLALPLSDDEPGLASAETEPVSLLQGYRATEPASNAARQKRRRRRAGLVGNEPPEARYSDMSGRLIRDAGVTSPDRPGARRNSAVSPQTKKGRKRSSGLGLGAPSSTSTAHLTQEELAQEVAEILQDQANIEIRKNVLSAEIGDVDRKIAALELIRQDLRRGLLSLREDRLGLEDELEGVRERLHHLESASKGRAVSAPSSRRRKGPSFLPSEHDELPVGVSFLSLTGHLDSITALDFTEPYGLLISASNDESLRMWDMSTGDELGFLRGHIGAVKCLQVEGSLCISGAKDGAIRLWDLEKAEEDAVMSQSVPMKSGLAALKEEEDEDENGLLSGDRGDNACIRTLTGHASMVTACYFEDNCLVTGSTDKTLRQWDLTTGQCVMTMDILWAISNPASQPLAASPPEEPVSLPSTDSYFDLPVAPTKATPKRTSLATLRRLSSQPFGLNTPDPFTLNPRASLSALEDFNSADYAVGGVMHWGYALASGSADGCVRMWDMRTGQAHRTLVGHVAPVTCLQFDEFHLVSGSLDKSVRIWDLRTGSIADTLRYDHPVTALQFDTRKIVAAAGEQGVKVFNRTTLQHSSLTSGGHTGSVTKLRFMDRFLASGGRDATVRLWSIA